MSPTNPSQVVLNLRLIQLQRLYFTIRIAQNLFIRENRKLFEIKKKNQLNVTY